MRKYNKIYVAGPYTKGDVAVNVQTALAVGTLLLNEGFNPFIPHLSHFWHLVYHQPYEKWLEYDMVWLRECDAVVRIYGESNGADKEVDEAIRLNKFVIFLPETNYLNSLSNTIKELKHDGRA